jgi:hypothetical protein
MDNSGPWPEIDSSVPDTVKSILLEVRRAIDHKFYYPALIVTLTLPDICAAATMERREFVKKVHYVNFINTYAKGLNLGVDGAGCYRLRGGLLHRGNAAGHPFAEAGCVIFTIPETNASIHALSIQVDEQTADCFDLISFCAAMQKAVLRWLLANSQEVAVQKNLTKLLCIKPFGVPPFMDGAPVIGSS